MSLRINDTAPDFEAETTQGKIRFHDWIGDKWAILFSHPKDFTPVCTTELGYMAKIEPEFTKRNAKLIGLSADPVDRHESWSKDIEETQGAKVKYPMIGDSDLKVAKLYNMLPADEVASDGRTAGEQRHRALGLRHRPGQEDQADAHLPDDHRPQLRRGPARPRLDPADRQAPGGDAGELEAGRGRDHRRQRQRRAGEAEVPRRLEGPEALPAHRQAAGLSAVTKKAGAVVETGAGRASW